jgi:DNA-binding transcriptional MerR regulator
LIENGAELVKFILTDPLYEVIKDTSLEEQLFNEEYLLTLEEKRWYSTPEVAEWFGINDGQLRYYIKPFHEYLFTDETPSSSTAYRLNIESILKLRMILLLKDEYRVKGLQRLVGLGEGFVQKKNEKSTSAEVASRDRLEKQVETLTKMMEQILKTGMFEMKQGENGTEITLRESFVSEQVKLLTTEDDTISEVRKIAEEIAKSKEEIESHQEEMKLTFNKSLQEDLAIRVKERRIEQQINTEVRAEAIKKWAEQNKKGFFAKLLQSDQIEIERELFISTYLNEHLDERLNIALAEYHQND